MRSFLARLRPTPALAVALVALLVALGTPSYAAKLITGKDIKNNSVTGGDIKNSSLTGKDVKNSSLTGGDLKNNTVLSADVKNGSLLAADFKAGELGQGIARKRVVATEGADDDQARLAAPEIVLFKEGVFTIYGKCYHDTTADRTYYTTYIKTSRNGAIFDSRNDSEDGGPNDDDFLNIGTDEESRELEDTSASDGNTSMSAEDDSDFTAFGPDGTALRGWTGGAVKNGTIGQNGGPFGAGSGNICLFTGAVFTG
ncbi:MAG: hypothetical protein CMH83_09505 [Nocardioides sp.]|nr:hypothetical protein [Nocardioides sp.]